MKFPSWNDFTLGIEKFENQINEKKLRFAKEIQLMDNHVVFDEIFFDSIPFLPSPFNSLTQAIYKRFQGSKNEKINSILKILESIKKQEKHIMRDYLLFLRISLTISL